MSDLTAITLTCLVCGKELDAPPASYYPTREEYERETVPAIAMMWAMEAWEVHRGHAADPSDVPDVIVAVPGLITTRPWEPNLAVALVLLGLAVTVGMGIAWLLR